MNRATREFRKRLPKRPAFGIDPLGDAVQRQFLISVELKDATDIGRLLGMNFNDASALVEQFAIPKSSHFCSRQ